MGGASPAGLDARRAAMLRGLLSNLNPASLGMHLGVRPPGGAQVPTNLLAPGLVSMASGGGWPGGGQRPGLFGVQPGWAAAMHPHPAAPVAPVAPAAGGYPQGGVGWSPGIGWHTYDGSPLPPQFQNMPPPTG
jgi:hypothetical protein